MIPVCHSLRGVTPLALARALDGAVRSGHYAERFATGLEELRSGPFRTLHLRSTEVFYEGNVAGCVAADDVLIAGAVPIETHRRG